MLGAFSLHPFLWLENVPCMGGLQCISFILIHPVDLLVLLMKSPGPFLKGPVLC